MVWSMTRESTKQIECFHFMRCLFRGDHKKRQKERLRKTKFIRFKDPRDRRQHPTWDHLGGGQGGIRKTGARGGFRPEPLLELLEKGRQGR